MFNTDGSAVQEIQLSDSSVSSASSDDEDDTAVLPSQSTVNRPRAASPQPGPSGLQKSNIGERPSASDTVASDPDEDDDLWEQLTDRVDKRIAMRAYWDFHYDIDRQAHMPRNVGHGRYECCSNHPTYNTNAVLRSMRFDKEEREVFRRCQIDVPDPSIDTMEVNISSEEGGDTDDTDDTAHTNNDDDDDYGDNGYGDDDNYNNDYDDVHDEETTDFLGNLFVHAVLFSAQQLFNRSLNILDQLRFYHYIPEE